MIFQNYPYFYIIFLSALISGTLACIAWNRRDVRGAKTFSIYTALIAWWSFFYALEITAVDPALHLFYLKVEYLAIPWIPAFVILFAMEFGGLEHLITKWSRLVIFLIPILGFLSYFTNDFHHWYYLAVHELIINGLTIIAITPGFMYVLLTSYIFFSICLCFLVFIRIIRYSPRVFLPQSVIFLFVLGILMITYLYYLFMPRIYPDFDITPITLAIAGVFVIIEMFQYQFFDLVHFPHRKIFEHLHDGVIILDTENRILEMNMVSRTILNLQDTDPIGEKFDHTESFLKAYIGSFSRDTHTHQTIKNVKEGSVYHYAVDMYPVSDSIQRPECKMIVIRDISDMIRSKTALSEAGKKLSLLNSITRHDILNQIMVISGYSYVITDSIKDDPKASMALDRIKDATKMIQQLIGFTSLYQDLGVSEPGWFHINEVALKAWNTRNPPDTITFMSDAPLVIFADMLLEKVFFNLIDNSLRHGGDITWIRVTSKITNSSAIVIYEDDGTGIPEENKEKIFKRGFGKNSGYGLFLVREILGITSIPIHETGFPGKGVRFEMKIPCGGFMVPAETYSEE